MTKKQYQSITGYYSTLLAIASFGFGTLLLIIHLLFPKEDFIHIGVIYVCICFILNSLMFLYLLFIYYSQKNHREYFLIKILILLANIPITFVYIRIVAETWN